MLGAALFATSLSAAEVESVVKYESQFSVQETADRFEALAKKKGLTLFARIDHQANAESVGLTLRPTQLVIFGNPKVGTPLMQCKQEVAIDLPQKMLISEDSKQAVWISYNNPEALKQRHHIEGCDTLVGKISNILRGLAQASAQE
ncbi:DUF302 domain-containing protein [Vibrio ostreicida]|uniref:DUF302 domain-containing protein n=2 Tax=Vibrio ostreicida TaxID=526588 RepID=A0ABT8BTD1_9VIBR|nr:DUF302 domain-containing protein [Vibrio ostreicida]MDN3610233.1 DUF302 domain-containing protein [Vibrio ostreicida]